eukprot:TRINITY_DN433_c0_g1_i3.p2 TRINITY_DN433_c0_g1~~TRINITY_DN433_c0_g1_i3.p2  ORF type:complete len:397 (-),score=108.56 TRINITY_DN433_c0_g1_i3:67-1257(-)
MDKYNTSDAPRQIRRLAEKENQKERAKSKREFNEIVCRLATTIRRMDPRVIKEMQRQSEVKKEKEQEAILKKQLKEEQLKKAREEMRNLNNEWLDQLNLEEMGIEVSDEDKDNNDEEFYCPACRKLFRSDKQWKNHEKSNKHKQNVALLKSSVTLDETTENELAADDKPTIEVVVESTPLPKINTSNSKPEKTNSDEESNEGDELDGDGDGDGDGDEDEENNEDVYLAHMLNSQKWKNNQQKKQNKVKPHEKVLQEQDEHMKKIKEKFDFVERRHNGMTDSDDEDEDDNITNKNEDTTTDGIDDPSVGDTSTTQDEKTPKKRRRRRKEKAPNGEDVQGKVPAKQTTPVAGGGNSKSKKKQQIDIQEPNKCGKCGKVFDSRSKLFLHIKSTGHALPL